MVSRILILFAIIAATSPAWSLNCYTCNSHEDIACHSLNKDIQEPQECDLEEDLCYSKTTRAAVNRKVTYRGCAKSIDGNPCKGISGQVNTALCYSCTEDGCNSANCVGSGSNIVGLMFLILLIVYDVTTFR